jgi:energy-coupling factor transporter ATP-binding protein EcfA2
MTRNPFPGPQPYRNSDRDRFYGREEMSYRLDKRILANRCVTVYGPSGAGKSSLVQAAVIPSLVESHEIRVVRVDTWPCDVDPTVWLADAMYSGLDLGQYPIEIAPDQAVLAAAQRAARRSSSLVLIYLDQIEQLLYTSWVVEEIEAFFECLGRLVDLPLRNMRVLLSLREDYLGRFRDRLREYRRLLEHGFRVGPLNVGEIASAVCQAAAAGEPPQSWELEPMRRLMRQVRVPGQAATDEAEAQAAYAQIVCRALFQQHEGRDGISGELEAEPVLRGYLETTLDALGPLRSSAYRLLEDHLVTVDGGRTLRTEKELLRLLPENELSPILETLEGAAILHAEEHQGSRYFEIGHDWLAGRVFEQRQVRVREEEQQRREEEQQRELRRQREEAEAKLAEQRVKQRRLIVIAIVSIVFALATGALGLWAWQQKRAADEARQVATQREGEAKRAQGEAEKQKKLAEELKQQADREKDRAEAEAKRAREAAEEAQRSRDQARHSERSARNAEAQAHTAEAQALSAEAKAREQEQKARQAAEEERRSRQEKEKLIDRAAGKIKDDL